VILVEQDDYILGIWLVDGPISNVLTIIKRKSGDRWHVHSRVRHYVDDKLFEESNDLRQFYHWSVAPDTPEEELISVANEVCRIAQELKLGTNTYCAMVRSSGHDAYAAAIASLPNMHTETRWSH
jgi:hypothetical protein